MQSVVETPTFLRAAAFAGMTAVECATAVDTVSRDPTGGVALGGGVYKHRVAGRGKGKSGGFRIISVYCGTDFPVILIGVLSKGQKDNFSKTEMTQLLAAARLLREDRR